MHTNFRHIFYLVKVADFGSITAASEEIGISQPAISAAIKSVEEQIGYQLFVRNPSHGVSLTQAGRRFIQHAKHLLNDVKNFEKFATGLGNELCGHLQIGCYSIIAPFIIPKLLAAFHQLYPKIYVSIHEKDLSGTISDLKNGFTDIAITYDFIIDESIEYKLLFEVLPHVIISTNDPFSEKPEISLTELCDKPLLLLDLTSESYFEQLFSLYKLTPNIAYRLKTFEMVRGLVGAGLGYSFGRLPIKVECTYDGSILTRIAIEEAVPKSKICLASPYQSRPIRAVEAFVNVCHSVYSDIK